ncbi:right-handed parallel beta-helix repeat-containing protein [Motilimonas sp. 1_MG-2023]|uniref:right-handed parallel beta-helix repeat-containing protein n=1 Tax=Motilimonas sp. 1_MG-2023 TaxID=3062672 RepID=UPI0026E2F85F|nr:right-handed parallel beta-helix repeat-containing protein [Motilimonas sp. 1_MG-2023]MDO6528111.1 right-handed parallel beta-helix repeat-containing protein [Motilimonas sp. 1_MG-2023]
MKNQKEKIRKTAISLLTILSLALVPAAQALEFLSIANINVDVKDAQIKVKTDEISEVYIMYGLNSANFVKSPVSSQKSNHVISLNNLKLGHIYHYRAVAKTGAGEEFISHGQLLRLKKTSTTVPVAVINKVDKYNVTSSSATIKVELDRAATATLNFGRGAYNGGSLVSPVAVNHQFELSGLDEGKIYHFEIDTETPDGFASDGADQLLRLKKASGPDITHLLVSDRGTQSAKITWRTSRYATGRVLYRKVDELEYQEIENVELLKDHNATLPNLSDYSEYHFYVESTDSNGLVSTSKPLSFHTLDSLPEQPSISEIAVSYLNDSENEGFVKVITTEDTRVWVTFGPSFRPNISNVSDFKKEHGIKLPSLIPGLFYRLEVHVQDADGNLHKRIQFFNPDKLAVDTESKITTEPEYLVNSFFSPRTTKVCNYNVSDIDAYSHIKLDCLLDLNNRHVTLKEGVSLLAAGGDIINGTLHMDHGEIDHRLLNSSVTVDGVELRSVSDNYTLDKRRWPLVEGIVEDSVAKTNRKILQHAFNQMAAVQTATLTLPQFDAYFLVGQYDSRIDGSKNGILLPSNTNLVMQTDTTLRAQPNGFVKYSILGTFNANNVKIKGGVLVGERDQHNYEDPLSDKNKHWGGTLMRVQGSTNIVIDGVSFIDAMGDGLSISSLRGYGRPDHIETQEVTVINNTFDNNRRLGMAITSGSDILVDSNTFLNSGQPTEYSTFASPGWAIDVEGARSRNTKGELYYIERPYNIVISNNVEKNSYKGAFIAAIGDHIKIINNTTESRLGIGQSSFVTIADNDVTYNEKSHTPAFAILNGYDGETTFYPIIDGVKLENNIIANNVLRKSGIYISGSNTDIYNNTIINAPLAFSISRAKDTNIFNNNAVINDDAPITYGNDRIKTYNGVRGTFSLNNVGFYNNKVHVKGTPLWIKGVNTEAGQSDYTMEIKGNVFTTTIVHKLSGFSDARNVTFKGNKINGLQVTSKSHNLQILDNIITQPASSGIHVNSESDEIDILGNTINFSGTRSACIKVSTDSKVNKRDNNCHIIQ